MIGEVYKKRGEKLHSILKDAALKGEMELTIQDVNSREIKDIQLHLKAAKITFPIPKRIWEKQRIGNNYNPIDLNVVVAYNEEQEWILLTNLPIQTLDQVKEVVRIYKARWHIEDYHKVLKTGYQVEEIYLHSSKETIKNLLVMASISACRLYWLIYIGRSETSIKADELFEEFEWKAIYVYFNEAIPTECPSISEVILKIARLGGYKPTSRSKPPGVKTIWIGYQQFTIAAQMYRNMSTKT